MNRGFAFPKKAKSSLKVLDFLFRFASWQNEREEPCGLSKEVHHGKMKEKSPVA